MTEWVRRSSPEFNQMYANSSVAISPYNTNGVGYVSGNMPYSQLSPTHSTYSSPFLANSNQTSGMMCLPSSYSPMTMNYQLQPSRSSTASFQPRSMTHGHYYTATVPSSRHMPQSMRYPLAHDVSWVGHTEDQDSFNQESRLSEPVSPPLEGYPAVEVFDKLMEEYVANLSPKKQDKALIHAKRAANIRAVLVDKKTTLVESAQFRFWVKKMFTLHPNDSSVPSAKKKICHDNKPVAIREKLFKILTKAHKECQHGGRDKTSAQVRRVYSWVPKELISRFVKICPTCQVRRGTNRGSPAGSDAGIDAYMMETTSPESNSADHSRRTSVANSQTSHTSHNSNLHSPLQMSSFSPAFQQQNRWMSSFDITERMSSRMTTYDAAVSSVNDRLGSGLAAMDAGASVDSSDRMVMEARIAAYEAAAPSMSDMHHDEDDPFHDQTQHLMKIEDSVHRANYPSMGSQSDGTIPDMCSHHLNPDHLSYQTTNDLRYGYRSNHYSNKR